MVAAVTYDEHSFWAGVAIGRRLKGYAAYGTMPGWDPDGDLIVRPVIQGVPAIRFGADMSFTITATMDTVDEDAFWPEQEMPVFTQKISTISFGADRPFVALAINERLVIDQVIRAYRLDKESKDVEYNEDIVYINADGAFTFAATVDHVYTSTVEAIDSGSMAALQIVTSDKENIQKVVIA